ncbi:hypothetical protein [Streptomyces sp. NPDC002851]
MKRRNALSLLTAALASVAVVGTVMLASGSGSSEPTSPGNGPSGDPREVQPAPTTEHEPGSASSYWTEERRRNASPADMPRD